MDELTRAKLARILAEREGVHPIRDVTDMPVAPVAARDRLAEHKPGWGESMEGTVQDIASILMGRTKGQQMAQDVRAVRRPAEAAIASAADPLGIPSAVTGMVSPETRDAWRATQKQEGLVPQMAGSLVGGTGLLKAGMTGAKSVVDMGLRSAGLSTASDFVDDASGKEGSVGRSTLGKAILSQFGIVPGRVANAVAGGTGGAILASGQAQAADAAPLSADDKARRAALEKKGSLNSRERAELKDYQDRGAATAATELADKRAADRAAAETAARIAEEGRQKQSAAETEASGRAKAAHDKVKAEAPNKFEDTWWSKHVNPTVSPAVVGALTGILLGGKSTVGARSNVSKWQSELDKAAAAKTPSASLDAQGRAKALAETFPANASPAKGYGFPMAVGAGEGVGSTAIGNYWDRNLPEANPDRTAIEAAVAQLPDGHPDRARYERLLNDPNAPGYAPKKTPAREAAENKGIVELGAEAGLRGAIGAVGGAIGKTVAGVPAPSAEKIAMMRALTNRPPVDPKAVAKEGDRMLSVEKADSAYRDASQAGQGGLDPQVRDGMAKALMGERPALTPSPFPPEVEAKMGQMVEAILNGNTAAAAELAQLKDAMQKGNTEAATILRSIEEKLAASAATATTAASGGKRPGSGAGKPGQIGWQNTWSDPARQAALDRIESGGTLQKGAGGWTAGQIQADIAGRLPPGTKPPSPAKINEQRRLLVDQAGDKPTREKLLDVFMNDPNRAIWSAAPIAAGGAALLSEEEAQLPPAEQARLLMARQLMNRPRTY